MVGKLTLDKAGRIVLPKPLRDELQLQAGDTLELESTGNEIILRPAANTGQMRKEHGVWVFHSGEPLTPEMVEKTAREVQEERDRRIRGEDS
jgi:AbrB family looped-hinge helix DNA binding protein